MPRYSLVLVSSATRAVSSVWDVETEGATASDDEYLMRLGVTVKHVRRRLLRIGQVELGRLVGRDKNTISRWENGKTSLSAFDLAQLWNALTVPGDWLLDPTDSVIELDRRIERLRGERLAQAALAASQEAEEERRRRADDGAAGQRGRRTA